MQSKIIPIPPVNVTRVVEDEASDRVFVMAAEFFSALATPIRLRILSTICNQGKSVSAIVKAVASTQPNVSQHLKMLYLAGLVAKHRMGNEIVYRVQSEEVLQVCRTVCMRIAIDLDTPDRLELANRLTSFSQSPAAS
ncbi:MAG: winged helix-turn-helix transcriptional regulator [Betaproteobacteria bacterium]|nr:winged helix-turn-helix transcriptional regulator [Betaproteobacteria bacterium]